MSIFDRSPSEWNLSRSVFSVRILEVEHAVEKGLHVWQTMNDRSESYSYLKGMGSLFVKIPFGIVGAVASLIEGVALIVLAGITYIFSLCHDVWREVPGNLFSSAISTNRTHEQWSALLVFVTNVALPFSELSYMLPKIWAALFDRKPAPQE